MKKFILLLLLFAIGMSMSAQQNVSIGIVSDFEKDDPRSKHIRERLLEGIQKTTGSAYTISLDQNNILYSQYETEKASENHLALASRCDLIILIGSISLQGGLQNQPLSVPTLALGVFDTELQNIPYTAEGTSGLDNFSYVLTSQNMEEDLSAFKELVAFKKLAFIFDQRTSKGINAGLAHQRIPELNSKLDAEITYVPVHPEHIASSLSKLPKDVDAAYLAIPFEMTGGEIAELTDVLNERKIPSLSMNQQFINQGVLFSFSSHNGFDYIVRKLAIMADEALRGENLKDMKVDINKKRELYMNMTTAQMINFSPDFQTLFTAHIIGKPTQDSLIYSIQDILKLTLEENLNIHLSNMDMELSEQELAFARSNYLPKVDASATAVWIDEHRANPLIGQAEQSISATAKVQQLIYSEQALANIKIQKYLLQAQEHATEQEILAQVLNCYNAYFGVLQAKTNVTIMEENLAASKTNLELAKLRASVGSRNKADEYRWESEVANAKQNLIEANTQFMIAKFQLNKLTNNTLPENFDVEDMSMKGELFGLFATSRLAQFINSPAKLAILTDFLIIEAQTNYPAKKQLLANLDALDRQEVMNKRMYYSPTLALSGQWDENLYRGGVGSEPLPGNPAFENSAWNATLSLSIPLYDANSRKINRQKTQISQLQLHTQIEDFDQNLALQVKANTLKVYSSGSKIRLMRISAENTENNFKLVQDNYKQGTVSITQLIDAQKAAINAKQAYSLSVYEYMINFLSLENSIGFYSLLSSPEEQEAFKERFVQYLAKTN